MRNAFHDDLDQLSNQLVGLAELAGSALAVATRALIDGDVELAATVIAGDARLDALRADLETHAVDLLARQAPVASDLRAVVTALRMASDLERMGDLARHVAKVARRRHPRTAVPPELVPTMTAMGQVAAQMVAKTAAVIATKNLAQAAELDHDDDAMDALHRQLYAALLAPSAQYPTDVAVDLALIGRYYERYGDHAVSVARRVVYLVTGRYATTPSA
ncbi:MAG TPA: phosphate signaling complex protein PhoU [Dermatophilaceae bacterium]|jgi:phosphate transport system protein|nr:phosphate signaling complex protein PhoU [Dermatophilaceae bacterium]